MESHLGGSAAHGGPDAVPASNVQQAQLIDQGLGDRPHGTVVDPHQLHRRDGVDPVFMHGGPRDARAPMCSEVFASADIREAQGSNTQIPNSDLPQNDPFGQGQVGTGQIYSASELEQVDQMHGTHEDLKPLQPGAYQLSNGNVLIVEPGGNRVVVSPQQWEVLRQRLIARQNQDHGRPAGLLGAVARVISRQ